MTDLAHWSAKHRRSILFLVAMLALAGVAAGFKLPVALFPQVNFPRVVVTLEAGDRPADQMVIAITRQVEQAVRTVAGSDQPAFHHQPRQRPVVDQFWLG